MEISARREVRETQRSVADLNRSARREAAESPQVAAPEARTVEEAVSRLNATMQALSVRLKFERHEAAGQYMVRVINEDSGELIREIPPERTLDMVAYLKRVAGIIVDERV
jgi:flagellar protein FlaG